MPIKRTAEFQAMMKNRVKAKGEGIAENSCSNSKKKMSDFANSSGESQTKTSEVLQTDSSGQPPIPFNPSEIVLSIPEGWQKATVLSVEETTSVMLKLGECRRIEIQFYLHNQQIGLYQNLLLISYPNSVIMQLVNACSLSDENRGQIDLVNLVNKQVFVRIQKQDKYSNVVEVKPLSANIQC